MNQPVDSPEETPRIAIIGAGPIGLEAALYARYLGYQTVVLECDRIASNVRQWGHVTMFSPFGMNRSNLGVAALKAQDPEMTLPSDEEMLTGEQFAERYLLPLAATDLLDGCIFEGVQVVSIGRDGVLKSDPPALMEFDQPSAESLFQSDADDFEEFDEDDDAEEMDETCGDFDASDRMHYPFRLLVRGGPSEDIIVADHVIDCSGVYNQPNFAGHGGIPAVGELALTNALIRHLPDVLGKDRDQFQGRETLVIGSGYSAATTVVALHQLAESKPETRVTWITRRKNVSGDGPLPCPDAVDPLPSRAELVRQANCIAMAGDGNVVHHEQTTLLKIERDDAGKFHVQFGGVFAGESAFDQIVSLTGFRPDLSILRELQVDFDPRIECLQAMLDDVAPSDEIALGDDLGMGSLVTDAKSVDDAILGRWRPDQLTQPEPGLFVLGTKSFGRNSGFLLSSGLDQIRAAFSLIAQRDTLDLYATIKPLAN